MTITVRSTSAGIAIIRHPKSAGPGVAAVDGAAACRRRDQPNPTSKPPVT
ncbi:MAG TPA: hypothetical protein VIJ23_13900 [Mycobacterium sp.]